jgi:osmotically-inducible protein OsmY
VFLREDAEIAHEIREDVIHRTLWIDPDTIRVIVRDGVVTVEGQLEPRGLLPIVERLVLATEGVVAFESRLSYPPDDSALATGYSSHGPWFLPRVNR